MNEGCTSNVSGGAICGDTLEFFAIALEDAVVSFVLVGSGVVCFCVRKLFASGSCEGSVELRALLAVELKSEAVRKASV